MTIELVGDRRIIAEEARERIRAGITRPLMQAAETGLIFFSSSSEDTTNANELFDSQPRE